MWLGSVTSQFEKKVCFNKVYASTTMKFKHYVFIPIFQEIMHFPTKYGSLKLMFKYCKFLTWVMSLWSLGAYVPLIIRGYVPLIIRRYVPLIIRSFAPLIIRFVDYYKLWYCCCPSGLSCCKWDFVNLVI